MLILSPKFRHSSTSYMFTCWHRKEAGPAVARQLLFEMDLHNCRHSTSLKIPIRLESCTDARLIRTSVLAGLHDQFGLILTSTFCSPWTVGWRLLIAQRKTAEITPPIKACGEPVSFAFPNLLLKGLMIKCSIALILVPMRDLFESWYGQAYMIINKRVFLILMLKIRYSCHLDEVAADICGRIGRTNVLEALAARIWWIQRLSFDSCTTET